MSVDRLGALYSALPEEMVAALDGPIAQVLKSRPSSVARRPVELRVKALRSFLARKRDDDLAGEILRAYLLGPRQDLVTGFLDATGVEHEQGQVADEAEPAAEKVGPAVESLLASHDPEDVRLYLEVAAVQWPDNTGVREALDKLTASA